MWREVKHPYLTVGETALGRGSWHSVRCAAGRMKATYPTPCHHNRTTRGFTLIELLVVIVVLAVLGGLTFTVAKRGMAAADASTCLNNLRQSGSALLQHSQESHGRLSFASDSSGAPEQLPYGAIASIIPPQDLDGTYPKIEVMHCPCAPSPETTHQNSYGVNFNDSEIAGVSWKDDSGSEGTPLLTLRLSTVDDSTRYPILMDSSIASGDEQFRIYGNSHPGMRHEGKANAFFLDGSARPLGIPELGKLGFARAYDCAQLPPASVSVSRS